MPDGDLVVSDTSPLLNLALIDRLDLLESQFSGVTVPSQVWDELVDGTVDIEAELDALRDAGFWIADDLYSRILSEATD